MKLEVHHHVFDNGLTLLAQRMPHVRSAAFGFLLPSGAVYDPPAKMGIATILTEMMVRGAGKRDSRELALALENLGVDHSENAGALHMSFWGSALASNLPAALEIYADIIRRPHLPAEELEPVKHMVLQELLSIEDEPRRKLMRELRRRHFPPPLGRSSLGTAETLPRISTSDVERFYNRYVQPNGAIMAIAGRIRWDPLRKEVEKLFGDWPMQPRPQFTLRKPINGRGHLVKDTTQTQMAFAFPSVPVNHEDYYAANGAIYVLSGGMSSRLFTEVREKRGLCYAVSARYQAVHDQAAIVCYASSLNERAQTTLEVMLGEIARLEEGVTEDEVERLRAGLKSALIMQQESTSSRASALAGDWYYLGRVRSPQEIEAAVNALTPDVIAGYIRRHPPNPITLMTLGPKRLRLPRLAKPVAG